MPISVVVTDQLSSLAGDMVSLDCSLLKAATPFAQELRDSPPSCLQVAVHVNSSRGHSTGRPRLSEVQGRQASRAPARGCRGILAGQVSWGPRWLVSPQTSGSDLAALPHSPPPPSGPWAASPAPGGQAVAALIRSDWHCSLRQQRGREGGGSLKYLVSLTRPPAGQSVTTLGSVNTCSVSADSEFAQFSWRGRALPHFLDSFWSFLFLGEILSPKQFGLEMTGKVAFTTKPGIPVLTWWPAWAAAGHQSEQAQGLSSRAYLKPGG